MSAQEDKGQASHAECPDSHSDKGIAGPCRRCLIVLFCRRTPTASRGTNKQNRTQDVPMICFIISRKFPFVHKKRKKFLGNLHRFRRNPPLIPAKPGKTGRTGALAPTLPPGKKGKKSPCPNEQGEPFFTALTPSAHGPSAAPAAAPRTKGRRTPRPKVR